MRILIYRLGSLGDTVLALPCFHLIRETYPDASVTVLTNAPLSGKAAPLESILQSTRLINNVIHYPLGLRNARDLLALRRTLRAGRFDLVISLAAARGLAASLRDILFFRACGIPQILGIPLRRRDLVCQLRPDGLLFESEAERLLRRVSLLGRPDLAESRWLDLRLTAEEKEEAAHLLSKNHLTGQFIAASLGTKTPLNDWGAEAWCRLLRQLSAQHPGLGLVLLGSPDEFGPSDQLLKEWAGPRANLCGATSPRVSAAILSKAALYIGHDSGPMHLAAAAGTRCVAIFSARCPPGQWFPVGSGHVPFYPRAFYDRSRIESLDHQRRALASITVDEVHAALERLLADSP